MSDKPTGGSAFPASLVADASGDIYTSDQWPGSEGMTLRDYFAAAALQRIPYDIMTAPRVQARGAYEMADAMLAEREIVRD